MNNFKLKLFYSFFALFLFVGTNIFSKSLNFEGLQKLSLDDIQTLTDTDIYSSEYNKLKINDIIKELYNSDLIFDLKLTETKESYSIFIEENSKIENIYFNGNIKFDDEILKNIISSNVNSFLNKDKISNDIDTIRSFYSSQGYYDSSINVVTEKVNLDKINLIFQISESELSKISKINFFGNKTFSDRLLSSIIFSDSKSDFNIFGKGSNLNPEVFDLDKVKLIDFYNDRGFNSVDISYVIKKNSFSSYSINFYINENYRTRILDINFDYNENLDTKLFQKILSLNEDLKKQLSDNQNFYDFEIINDYLTSTNDFLISQNLANKIVNINVIEDADDYDLNFYFDEITPKIIDKINITGNSITRDSTLRSKLSIEPGDYYNKYKFEKDLNYLKSLRYINAVDSNLTDNPTSVTIDLDINENKKTGNILLAGTANSDTGLGLSFGISDDNIFGLGDKINSSVSVNSKSLLFNIDYQQYFTSNPYLSNRYKFFNSEKDFTSSYGYKSKNTGISYSIYYDIDDQTSSNVGIDYTNNENHSATISSDNSISDSIGEFNNFKIFYSLTKDSTNDRFYPSEGSLNKLFLELSPDELSDDPFIRITLKNTIFFDNNLNSNFFFIDNNIGLAEPLKGKLKTKETFNLGGLNFKGFKYNGIGPLNSNNIYLGGNKYFTSTLGYGSKFLFDEKDNVNFKIFTTVGSLWDSDYTNSEFKLRSSAGISFDFLTAVGPISFSYSVPINKSNKDESDNFNFTIGTSF